MKASIKCVICGRFMSYKDFEEGKTRMVWETYYTDGYDPPEYGPAHEKCAE